MMSSESERLESERLESVRSIARLLLSLRKSDLQQSTQDRMHRILLNISYQKGHGEKAKAAKKLIPLIEAGISDEELLKVLEEMEAEL